MTEQEVESEAQAIEGYGCKCGFKTDDLTTFRTHLRNQSLINGKGTHTSIGRVNMTTGKSVMPPYLQRTKEQKDASKYSVKKQKDAIPQRAMPTDAFAEATQIKFVPRVFTVNYSPVLHAAQEAAIRIWGWPRMPLEDFIDTVIWRYFRRCGVTLTGFYVDETPEERVQREKAIAQLVEQQQKEAGDGSKAS